MADEGLGRDDGTFSEQRRVLGYDQVFRIGDRVEKRSGYRFPGIVTAIDETTSDAYPRYVVTADHPDFAGMKHIFAPWQLRPRTGCTERRYRHLKRGSTYTVVDDGELQTSRPLVEGDIIRAYRSEDGRLWLRPADEFLDGRFEEIDSR